MLILYNFCKAVNKMLELKILLSFSKQHFITSWSVRSRHEMPKLNLSSNIFNDKPVTENNSPITNHNTLIEPAIQENNNNSQSLPHCFFNRKKITEKTVEEIVKKFNEK
jgi:hypothetical protein